MTALSPEEHRDAAAMLLAQATWWPPYPADAYGDVRIDPADLPLLAAAQVHATLAGVTPSPQLPSVDIAEPVVAEGHHMIVTNAGTNGTGTGALIERTAERDRARATAVHLEQQCAAALALHWPDYRDEAWCAACKHSWPCPTAQALGAGDGA